MRIAGFDPGLKTGWAVYDSLLAPHWWWGVFELKYETPLAKLQEHLGLLAAPNEVWIERPVGQSFWAMMPNTEKVACIKLWAGEGICHLVQPASVKKFATGNGHAKKNDMIEAARNKWGRKVTIEHEADALWIAEYGRVKGGW